MLVMLVALTPVPRQSPNFTKCADVRVQFYTQLAETLYLLQLTQCVVNPEEHCHVRGAVDPEQHSSAAAFVLQELVEKLSLEESGELLLEPIGMCTELIDHLVSMSLNSAPHVSASRRRSSAKLLCFLLRRAAEPEIICLMATAPGAPPTQAVVPNRLFPLRVPLITHMDTRLDDIFAELLAQWVD